MTNILYADSDKKMPIIGAGIIFYRFNSNNRIELLLNKNLNAKYEDLGLNYNLTSDNNIDYFDIMLKNIEIITNNVITKDLILEYPSRNYYVYNSISKYLIILLKANSLIKNIDCKSFTSNEIDWISLYRFSSKNILKHSVSNRIKSKHLIYKIKEIEYMHRLRLITKKLNLSPATSDDFSTDSTLD